MTDDERRLEAAATELCKLAGDIGRPCLDHYNEAKAAIDAYNAPLEPEVPELVMQMATAMLDVPGMPLNAVLYARAALDVVVRDWQRRNYLGSSKHVVPFIAHDFGLSEQYVTTRVVLLSE